MGSSDRRAETIVAFLRGLRRQSGGYADTWDGKASLRATLSVLKALDHLGHLEPSGAEARVIAFIRECRQPSGGFGAAPGAGPTPLDTTAGLIALHTLGQHALLDQWLPEGLAYLRTAATSKFDHFMLIATYEECQVADPVPAASVDFFRQALNQALAEHTVVDAAIAGSALMRARQPLPDPDAVLQLVLSGQTPEGSFGDDGHVSLFGTYCVLRQLVLLNTPPNVRRLQSYLDSLRVEEGYAMAPGGAPNADATYQCLSMGEWLGELQHTPVQAARNGDVAAVRAWLQQGGDPNLADQEGWTPLLAAASHGQADVVMLLLSHDIEGAPRADPSLRFVAADALPLYMAGQSGDVRTVQALLKAAPEHLHAISSVNGHTVLLQAAFYGKDKHLELARWLLDHAAEVRGLPESALVDEQVRLLSATNVRGYNALGMQDLWHNEQMRTVLLAYYPGGPEGERGQQIEADRQRYLQQLLLSIATPQALTEKLMVEIATYLETEDLAASEQRLESLLTQPHLEINRLGGELQMPPLVFALTGVDVGHPERARRRRALVQRLLAAGADPAVRERHPMAVGSVIRASVLNNFGLLQVLAKAMTPEAFAAEMNVKPAVNGLTAMHDAVHRALTSPPAELAGHVAQITWMIEHGARLDIPEHTGHTPRMLAEAAQGDAAFPAENVRAVLAAIEAASAATAAPAAAPAATAGN